MEKGKVVDESKKMRDHRPVMASAGPSFLRQKAGRRTVHIPPG